MGTKYIAYYRVSTKSQESNHSLEAQKQDVHKAVGSSNIMHEFTDIDSGKNTKRKELKKAMELCKANGYTLISFRLDRLTRNLKTIIELQENKIKYTALDCINDSQMIIEIKTSINQDFLRQLSDKTRAGIRIAHQKGRKSGKPENLTQKARSKGLQVRIQNSLENPNSIMSNEIITDKRMLNWSWNKIAKHLTEKGFKAPKGGKLTAIQVQRIFNKYNQKA